MTRSRKKALVVGGSGLVGRHLIQALAADDWEIVSTQRRVPMEAFATHRVIALDLLDGRAARAALGEAGDVTHVFFLARAWQPGYLIERNANVEALTVVLDALQDLPSLMHVQLIHGLKWYGSTLGPFQNPARESDPKPPVEHFYYDQRALVEARARGRHWHWSTLRPHCVCGIATGSPSNLMLGLGVYAALTRAQGKPLSFPSTQAAFEARLTVTNADLLTRAMLWAATDPAAQDQDFNVANGDTFSWREVWPVYARAFGMEPAGPQPRALCEEMPALAEPWRELARREGLAYDELSTLVDWHFMDATLALGWDQTMSLDKLRRHGFGDAVDTSAMILDILTAYRHQGILPR